MKCVFCGSEGPSDSVAHIIPKSLGGPQSPVGRPGATCDQCNQYFGQKVEEAALRSFPFGIYRVLASIPTKKGKMPATSATLGQISGGGQHGFISIAARSSDAEQGIADGRITQCRVLAEITEPLAVCRLALKVGIEMLAKHYYEVAISPRVAAAREFARRPRRGGEWWAIVWADPAALLAELNSDAPESEVEVFEHQGCLTSVLRLPGVAVFVPLEEGTEPPPPTQLPEPEYRIVQAMA
jgi:hypothetical protein